MRIALGIEYEGTPFSGWQIQKGARSVQACVEEALSRVADHPVRVTCAGRTDTGVHACGQVVHFDSEAVREPRSWVRGANANLPAEVSVLWAQPVEDDFHARFGAVRRRYRYVIFNRPVRPTFMARRVTWAYRPLDEGRMAAAARYLLGEHDFSSYRAMHCQARHPVRRIERLEVAREGQLVFIEVEANAFLHHMVRNISGVLMTIGAGERAPEWAREVLEARNRTLGGVTAPPHGLYLERVWYPEKYRLPSDAAPTLAW